MAVNKVVYGSETLIDLTEDTATADTVAEGYTLHLANGQRTTGTAKYAGAPVAGGPATVSNGLHFAQVDSTSTSTVFTATVPDVGSYYDGLTVVLKNGVVTSASGFTININGLGAKPVYNSMAAASRETTIFNVNYTLLLIYDETRVDGGCWVNYRGYYTDSNTVPTGYCTTAAGTAAKSATCTYGYRDDDNYFPCLFRYANTAANATLAIASYATTAEPIYVNGARTSSSNTFGRGVILFLYHNGAYYCYNDGRFPILVDGAVTSVQEYIATKYTKPSGGIPASDLAPGVIPTVPSAYTSTPANLGTASAGSSTNWARGDHVHKMPSASDVGAYALPSGGIPKSDLDSTVQTSLGKADTALQTHQPLKTVNGDSLIGTGNISITGLPAVTASDNGKVATVVNGAWAAVSLPSASGVSF